MANLPDVIGEAITKSLKDFFKKDGKNSICWNKTASSIRKSVRNYRTNNPSKTLKFIIHPKSKVSKAYDIGWQKYGESEVVYPRGAKFKVLDKRIEEYIHTIQERNIKTNAIDEIPSTLHRWIVELQEI